MDILLVDDDIDYLHLFSMFLKIEGFDAVATSHAIHALELLEKENFRMMITDFYMPGMNGLELAAIVRERHSDIPIVLITGSAMEEHAEKCAELGISEIFTKPVDLQRLLAVLRSALQGRQTVPGCLGLCLETSPFKTG